MRRVSAAAIEMIKEHEGLKLAAYRDPVGILTIGWGHTRGVRHWDKITREMAEGYLAVDIGEAEECIHRLVNVDLNQGQFDALVSFVFNLGCGNLQRSTLLRRLNEGDYFGAADEFLRWTYAGGREMRGLIRRRNAEREMFLRVEGERQA